MDPRRANGVLAVEVYRLKDLLIAAERRLAQLEDENARLRDALRRRQRTIHPREHGALYRGDAEQTDKEE